MRTDKLQPLFSILHEIPEIYNLYKDSTHFSLIYYGLQGVHDQPNGISNRKHPDPAM